MPDLGLLAGSGWAAGLNLWSVGLVLGLAGRLNIADTPEVLQRWWVLVALGALYACEFVVDKIPVIDSAWDIVSTVIRPVGAALIGIAIAGDADMSLVTGALTSGGFALTSHVAKATTRAAINMSPEPITNWIASVTEDVGAVGLSSLALAIPGFTFGLVIVLAVIAVMVIARLWRFVRRVRSMIRTRLAN